MDRLIISDTGFPLDLKALRFMRDFYESFIESLGTALGDNVIINGVIDDGTDLSSGWIVHEGEIMPFQGAPTQGYYKIVETVDDVFYDNNAGTTAASNLPAFKTRIAVPSTNTNDFDIDNLKRITQLINVATIERAGAVTISRDTSGALQVGYTGDVISVVLSTNGEVNLVIAFDFFAFDYAVEVSYGNNIGTYPLVVHGKNSQSFKVKLSGADPATIQYASIRFKLIG